MRAKPRHRQMRVAIMIESRTPVHRIAGPGTSRGQRLRRVLETGMKLVSFRVQTPVGAFIRVGALYGESVVDLNMAYRRTACRSTRATTLSNSQCRCAGLYAGPARRRYFGYGKGSRGLRLCQAPRREHARPRRRVCGVLCESIRMMAPLPNPPSLRDFIAFEDHIAATSKKRGQPDSTGMVQGSGLLQGQPSHDHRPG